MVSDTLTGSRIRERRIMAGLKQADLAQRIGISASYLNLIEHNRRRIGGKVLLNIASTLGVDTQTLTEGAEAALIAALREAADDSGLVGEEAAQADQFAGRYPGWADVLVSTRKRVAALEQTVEALTDRLSHDPHLAASMHELLSTAAAIRSTASILNDNKALQPEWRERFHANINEDSRRLADSAETIVNYLDATDGSVDAASSPQEEVERFLAAHDFGFAALEKGDADNRTVDQIIEAAPELVSQSARFNARNVLRQVAQDARHLSLKDLRGAIDEVGIDPLALAAALGSGVARVLRRLAAVPELAAGLVVCDRSGTVIFRKSVQGFTVPRHGSCCPLWPVFSALASPSTVIREQISQLGRADAHFDCIATCETMATPEYNAPPLTQAVMLLLPLTTGSGQGEAVGSACRICPHGSCAARREPSVLSVGV